MNFMSLVPTKSFIKTTHSTTLTPSSSPPSHSPPLMNLKELLGRPLVPFFGTIQHKEGDFAVNDTGENIAVRKFNKDGNFEEPVIIVPTKYKENYKDYNYNKNKNSNNTEEYENNFNVEENVEKYAMSSSLIAPAAVSIPLPTFKKNIPNSSPKSSLNGNNNYLILRKNGEPIKVPLTTNNSNVSLTLRSSPPPQSKIINKPEPILNPSLAQLFSKMKVLNNETSIHTIAQPTTQPSSNISGSNDQTPKQSRTQPSINKSEKSNEKSKDKRDNNKSNESEKSNEKSGGDRQRKKKSSSNQSVTNKAITPNSSKSSSSENELKRILRIPV